MSVPSERPIIFLSPYVLCNYNVSRDQFDGICKSLQRLLDRVNNAAIVLLFPVDVIPRQYAELKSIFGDRLIGAIPCTRSIHLLGTNAIHRWVWENRHSLSSFAVLDNWDKELCYPDRQVYIDYLLRHEHLKQAFAILEKPFTESEFSKASSIYLNFAN